MRAARSRPILLGAPKIGIAHGTIVPRDAVGHDILGQVEVLSEAGFEACLIADHFAADLPTTIERQTVGETLGRRDLDLLIYHHSIQWDHGETLLRSLATPRLMKYHNVTPPEFFAGYTEHYAELCKAGRAQTARLVKLFGRHDGFAADSAHNAAELVAAGARKIFVAPPFMRVAIEPPRNRRLPVPPYRALFVGRLAPNKGHFDLLDVVAAYVAVHGPGLCLQIVGGWDDALEPYRDHVEAQIDQLGIRSQVELLGAVDHDRLLRCFAEADLFLCMSLHEGFCVPVIEAQAIGLPVVSVDTAALAETLGPDQLVVPAPRGPADYLHIARLVHAACSDPVLRRAVIRAGYRNVLRRFTPAQIGDRFMDALVPLLEHRT